MLKPTVRTFRVDRAANPTTTDRPRTACVLACGLVMATNPGWRLPTAMTVVSGLERLPLPSSTHVTNVTCEPGVTFPGTATEKTRVYAVTAERTVSATDRTKAPDNSVVTNFTPRLSVAVTVKAKIESALADRTTLTLGAELSSVL
jgi:hypothetical protein